MNERTRPMRAFVCGCLLFVVAAGIAGVAQSKPATGTSGTAKQLFRNPLREAWAILKTGVVDDNTDTRATAVRVLGLIPNNSQSRTLAERALADKKPEVRAAAAMALGQMGAKSSVPRLRRALDDKEPSVVLAAANSLRTLHDPAAYSVYYAILTGQSKTGAGLIAGQEKMLKDPKKMALFGFEQGIGQIPFAGMGYQVIKALTKDDTSPVRAAAAKALAKDPESSAGEALVAAVSDSSWVVRAAALDAIADRGDPALLSKITHAMTDDKDAVRYTAAAAVVHLSSILQNLRKRRVHGRDDAGLSRDGGES